MDLLLYLVSLLGLVIPSVSGVVANAIDGDGVIPITNDGVDEDRPQDKMLILLNKTMMARKYPDCSNPGSLACLEVKKKMSGFKVSIHTCPTVDKVHLQLTTRGHFKRTRHGSPNIKTRGDRKEVLINRPRRRQEIWVSSRDGEARDSSNISPGLLWRYKAPTKHSNGTVWRKGTECSRKINSRRKRASKDDGYNSVMNDLKHCGSRQSCIRFGTKDCRHLECEYLITYKIVNRTVLHLEISGKTDGWVALGLSSDNKMGGDDVIACKRRSVMSDELVALAMTTRMAHAKPQAHRVNDLNLEYSRIDGPFIYCKMTRILQRGGTTSDAKLDLTNNWFQLYARGDIDNNGFMLKHTKTPPTSLETITMLMHSEINSIKYEKLTNSASSPILNPFLGIALICSVFGRIYC